MTWFRLDDQFHDHPKVIAAGNAAIGLYCRLGTWIADKLTDGFIPESVAKEKGSPKELRALVECPIPNMRALLIKVTAGYLMPDYLQYNPSREKVLAEREAAKQRMNKLRGSPDVHPNTSANEHPNLDRSSLSPVPVPLEEVLTSERSFTSEPVDNGEIETQIAAWSERRRA